jgi:hypothetical protein
VDAAGPQLGDDARGTHQGLVMHGSRMDVLGSATLGDASPTLGSSGAMGLGLSDLLLLGSPGLLPPPID